MSDKKVTIAQHDDMISTTFENCSPYLSLNLLLNGFSGLVASGTIPPLLAIAGISSLLDELMKKPDNS